MSVSKLMVVAFAALLVSVASTATVNGESGRGARVSVAQELPDGPGKELVSKLCDGCHDLMFTVSTRETREGWTRIVNDMRSKGADGADKDFDAVIAYLAANFGKPEPAVPAR
jgi:cytochrome c5